MRPNRETTVLFADVAGSTKLYEEAGDKKAADGIRNCLAALRGAAEASGGRVVKNIGDEILALFPSADRAAEAATRMHVAVHALPAIEGQKLSLRIAFHAGPVVQRGGDVFGDTVNLASRLVAQATRGQVLTCAETVKKLTPVLRNSTRQLYDITVKGKAADIALCELLWSKSADTTDFPLAETSKNARKPQLRLRFGEREIIRRRVVESISIGRDPQSTFAIDDSTVSRRHCVIERRQHNFVLRDHSANGTFISLGAEQAEIVLRREEFVLRGHGWLSFGQPKGMAAHAIEYFCEDDASQPPDSDLPDAADALSNIASRQ